MAPTTNGIQFTLPFYTQSAYGDVVFVLSCRRIEGQSGELWKDMPSSVVFGRLRGVSEVLGKLVIYDPTSRTGFSYVFACQITWSVGVLEATGMVQP
jgi:hypothetical protein